MAQVPANAVGRKKVIWGFGRLLPHIKNTIDGSRFIPTDEKDSLYSSIQKSYEQLKDAITREFGDIPITPSQEMAWKERINRVRRAAGKEPIKESTKKVKKKSTNPLLDELVETILKM